ncbi:MAG: carbamoyltransferase HypF [Anaerosomatales bacterium]|nr:carbamoyltransferase HypF [Anaerosomatales bacterium]MDT8433901.1 carbamoyltransferase HypF [Anaerosomatales bacterium]
MKALSLHITGIVQGVGFRPFVYNLANSSGLEGWVLNSSEGVFCLVQGDAPVVDGFPEAVRSGAPPMSLIEAIVAEEVEPEALSGFSIRESAEIDGAMTLVSPDIATCAACTDELFDPTDRRHGYPFINCTNCGPRFTIIDDVPYDRPSTAMREFEMCPQCAAEYADPSDRRFHAQPDACFVCGPRLYLQLGPDTSPPAGLPADAGYDGERIARRHRDETLERTRSEAILDATASLLLEGHIVALKGLGGFHLACDATNENTVDLLRQRKQRWGKPLAIMVATLEDAEALCSLTPAERSLLSGTARPIVLARRRDSEQLASSVAGDLPDLGIMLPYTPLHHLLLAAVGRPLVMTSGNLSDEPIATGNTEALERLSPVADAFLAHDRDIRSRYDDSVVREIAGFTQPVRRARGYAPHPIALPFETDVDILAVGPEQKNTFALLTKGYAFVSQHIGDMNNALTLEHFHATRELYERLFRVHPTLIAHDLHPEYLSTKFALALDLPRVGVQHHHAHIAGVAAEHGVRDPVVGIAFDGTGYGDDGHIWGGEVLLTTWERYERIAHLREVPLPGGAAAIRRPARMALGTLLGLDSALADHPGAGPLLSRLADGEERLLRQMIERGVNCPPTSSMGRLFDAVTALAGVRDDAIYEGQAAIELEAAIDPDATGSYTFDITAGGPAIIDQQPVIEAVLADVAAGVSASTIAARFHRAVVACIVTMGRMTAASAGTRHVALSGGVFLNRFVLEGAWQGILGTGLEPLTHVRLPVSDGSVSFGQGIVAWSRRREV